MKVTELLNEAIVKHAKAKDLDVEKAIGFLNKNCRSGLLAIKNGGVLFRGVTSSAAFGDFTLVDTKTLNRTSRDSYNGYQLMMDYAKELKDVPSRSNSLICTTSSTTASGYGTVYAVFPVDGTKIAVSTTDDFLQYTPRFSATDEEVYRFFKRTFKVFVNHDKSKIEKAVQQTSVEQMILNILNVKSIEAACDFLASRDFLRPEDKTNKVTDKLKLAVFEYVRDRERNILIANLFDACVQAKPKDRLSACAKVVGYTKQSLGISVVEVGKQLQEDVECWFSGRAVFIKLSTFRKILISLYEQNESNVNIAYQHLI